MSIGFRVADHPQSDLSSAVSAIAIQKVDVEELEDPRSRHRTLRIALVHNSYVQRRDQ